jgi:hypothetical protein
MNWTDWVWEGVLVVVCGGSETPTPALPRFWQGRELFDGVTPALLARGTPIFT